MQIEVLGCHGGEVPGFSFCSLRIDRALLVDAGRVTSVLPLAEQREIEHVLVGHSHFDHLRDLLALAQNRAYEGRAQALAVWGLTETVRAMREHLFNGVIWPDFARLPANRPALTFHTLELWTPVTAGMHQVTAVPMEHSVPSCGVVVERDGVALMVGGDGAPSPETCARLRSWPGLAACVFEATFCNAQEDLARRTGHMTPHILAERIQRIARPELAILLYHLSPPCYREICAELDELPVPVRVLQAGETVQLP